MKKIVGDLLKNRNIEESLKKYTGGFMKINNKYALIRLAMNYYTYYVSVSEDGGMVAPGFNEYVKTINETIEMKGVTIELKRSDVKEKKRESMDYRSSW